VLAGHAVKRALLLVAASAAVYTIVACWAAAQLPTEDVAMQVNTAGEVNKAISRADAVGFFIGLGSFLVALAVAVLCLMRLIPPRMLNVPHREYWLAPDRAPTAREMAVWDTAVLFSLPLLALSFIPVTVALSSTDPKGTSALWIVVPVGLWIVAMIGYIVWMYTGKYRPRGL
jgi:hypothetical protein